MIKQFLHIPLLTVAMYLSFLLHHLLSSQLEQLLRLLRELVGG